jgi:hypothetical protein
MSNLLKQFWQFQPICEQQRWPLLLTACGETTVNVMCSANSANTSTETVDFVSRCVDGEVKL